MQIRQNRDPMKIAAATLTPVLLTLILAKAAGPLDDREAVPAAEPAHPPTSPEIAANSAALEPVLFGLDANAPQASTPMADTEAAGVAQPDGFQPKADLVPNPAYPARVAIAPAIPGATQAVPGVPALAAVESVPAPVIAPAPESDEAAPVDPPAPVAAPAEPVELAAATQPQAADTPPTAPDVNPPEINEPSLASAAPAPVAAEDASRVAAALDKAKAETARAEALASSPGDGPRVLPETRLALADWNYSLPPGPSRVSGFADSNPAQGFGSAPAQPAARTVPASKAKSRLAQPSGKKAAVSGARRSSAGFAAAQPAHSKYRMVGSAIEFQLPVQVDGEAIGQLTMHVVPNQPVALHLKELVSLFAAQIEPEALAALNASSSINQYITFERLREAGIDIRYDAARDQIRLAVDQP